MSIKNITLISSLVLLVGSAKAGNAVDEIQQLRAELKLARSTIRARDKTIKTLKGEIKSLKSQPVQQENEQLKTGLAEANKKIRELSKVNASLKKENQSLRQPAEKNSINGIRQLEMVEVAKMKEDAIKKLHGVRVSGTGGVGVVEVDPKRKGKYLVTVNYRCFGKGVRHPHIQCVLRMNEENALHLKHKNVLINFAGDVVSVKKSKSSNIVLHLNNVSIRNTNRPHTTTRGGFHVPR